MASAEDYESVMGGSLKLKGVNLRLPKGLKKKKKKKKKKDKRERKAKRKERDGESDSGEGEWKESEAVGGGGGAGGDAGAGEKTGVEATSQVELLAKKLELTPAQIAHERHRKKRQKQVFKQTSKLSHRQKIDKFNQYLADLPVHFDIPKVASAGNG